MDPVLGLGIRSRVDCDLDCDLELLRDMMVGVKDEVVTHPNASLPALFEVSSWR